MRKDNECLIYGNLELQVLNDVLVYKRTFDGEMFVVVTNLTSKELKKPIVKDVVLSNYNSNSDKLRPYEVIVCKKVEKY